MQRLGAGSAATARRTNGDPLTVPNALLFRAMAEHGRVALNGEGGDPCFGGPKNLPMLLAELYGDGNEIDDGSGDARLRTYLPAHLKCFDELPTMLAPEVMRAACPTPAARRQAVAARHARVAPARARLLTR